MLVKNFVDTSNKPRLNGCARNRIEMKSNSNMDEKDAINQKVFDKLIFTQIWSEFITKQLGEQMSRYSNNSKVKGIPVSRLSKLNTSTGMSHMLNAQHKATRFCIHQNYFSQCTKQC